MVKLKRRYRHVWGCIAYAITCISSGVIYVLLSSKPDESGSKSLFDKASEAAFVVVTGCAVTIAGWMGGWPNTASALAIVAVADYVTGFAAACFHKSKKTKSGGLSSKVGFFGLMKKVFMFLAIIVAHQVDVVLPQGGNAFRDVVIGCLLANEGLSFYENVALFGVPFPKKLRRVLDQLREPDDGVLDKNQTETKGSDENG